MGRRVAGSESTIGSVVSFAALTPSAAPCLAANAARLGPMRGRLVGALASVGCAVVGPSLAWVPGALRLGSGWPRQWWLAAAVCSGWTREWNYSTRVGHSQMYWPRGAPSPGRAHNVLHTRTKYRHHSHSPKVLEHTGTVSTKVLALHWAISLPIMLQMTSCKVHNVQDNSVMSQMVPARHYPLRFSQQYSPLGVVLAQNVKVSTTTQV